MSHPSDQPPLIDADAAQAALAYHLAKHESRDIIAPQLAVKGRGFIDESRRDSEFFLFKVEDDGYYVDRQDGAVFKMYRDPETTD